MFFSFFFLFFLFIYLFFFFFFEINDFWDYFYIFLLKQEFQKSRITYDRSSRSQMLFKTGALENSAIFTRKHLRWSLFIFALKFFIEKRLQHRYFKYCKTFKKGFCYRTLLSTWPYYLLCMINEHIAFKSCAMSQGHVSIKRNLQLRINIYKRENGYY